MPSIAQTGSDGGTVSHEERLSLSSTSRTNGNAVVTGQWHLFNVLSEEGNWGSAFQYICFCERNAFMRQVRGTHWEGPSSLASPYLTSPLITTLSSHQPHKPNKPYEISNILPPTTVFGMPPQIPKKKIISSDHVRAPYDPYVCVGNIYLSLCSMFVSTAPSRESLSPYGVASRLIPAA